MIRFEGDQVRASLSKFLLPRVQPQRPLIPSSDYPSVVSIRSTSGRKESALQSGKHHQRVNDAQTLMLDDMELTWEKRHPMFSDWRKELKGYSVSVWLKPGRTKELILDVPFAVYGLDHLPNTDRWNQVLSMAIRSAMDAGWDPESRGGARRHTPE